MDNKYVLLKGTLLLTGAGFITKIIGFIYRIFLSQTIGAEGMGIYQLIFPIHTLCFALSVGGIQTAISRFTAARASLKNEQGARDIFVLSGALSTAVALIVSLILYENASWFAVHILLEERCTSLLKLMAFSIPMGTLHSCVNGYYYAKKKMSIPAASQLLEQCARVGVSYGLFLILTEQGLPITPMLAVAGLVGGELVSMIFSLLVILWDYRKAGYRLRNLRSPGTDMKEILAFSFPLTCSRLLVNILHSIESVLIPGHLRLYGLDNGSALSIYGVLTGMALPLILFPSAITNAVSTVLLPSVAEQQAVGNHQAIRRAIFLSAKYCLILGFLSTAFFFFAGDFLGLVLFKNEFAATFIKTLAFICPCLYLSGTLSGILNGLGAANQSFILNTLGLGVRIAFVFFIIPEYGIQGYLWGLIVSELLVTGLSLYFLREYFS
ncbi:MAG TPA: polysaccharide biosynthesis protein [Candidatus Blautia stercorigallinarum]|uniref:Polysaccharide biosynthesis protein n=1 Tax=Candidatus Blautia stercorigallinarum TaxID=2838501 RepID=A0A9D1PFA6_9FIRM|nr:polysaccharide biosynthesis protein [Candidatus Blautia stercorigallinarum]